jgi:hypothetical protein
MFQYCNFSHEAFGDLIALMGSLVDSKGKILVPGVNDTVKELTEAEAKLYEVIDFDMVSNFSYHLHVLLLKKEL